MSPAEVCGYLGASGDESFRVEAISKELKIHPFHHTCCLLLLFLREIIMYISASITTLS